MSGIWSASPARRSPPGSPRGRRRWCAAFRGGAPPREGSGQQMRRQIAGEAEARGCCRPGCPVRSDRSARASAAANERGRSPPRAARGCGAAPAVGDPGGLRGLGQRGDGRSSNRLRCGISTPRSSRMPRDDPVRSGSGRRARRSRLRRRSARSPEAPSRSPAASLRSRCAAHERLPGLRPCIVRAGSRCRSTFPFGVSAQASRSTKEEGTMCSGRRSFRKARSAGRCGGRIASQGVGGVAVREVASPLEQIPLGGRAEGPGSLSPGQRPVGGPRRKRPHPYPNPGRCPHLGLHPTQGLVLILGSTQPGALPRG